jgi:hypothetical protein
MAGTAPRADVWVVVEHPGGWGDAPLARSGHGTRVLMARASREATAAADGRTRVWVAHCAPPLGPMLRVAVVDDPGQVAGWDLAGLAAGSHRQWGEPDQEPLLLVCANGRRDRCCGHAGGRLADRLWTLPDAGRVLTSTHLGGHRFAPTALLLPWGQLHGRLDEGSAAALVPAARQGWTASASLRGASTLDPPAQVAEVRARQVTGYRGMRPLAVTLVGDPTGDHLDAHVTLPQGSVLDVGLARVTRALAVSCGQPPRQTEHWVVRD